MAKEHPRNNHSIWGRGGGGGRKGTNPYTWSLHDPLKVMTPLFWIATPCYKNATHLFIFPYETASGDRRVYFSRSRSQHFFGVQAMGDAKGEEACKRIINRREAAGDQIGGRFSLWSCACGSIHFPFCREGSQGSLVRMGSCKAGGPMYLEGSRTNTRAPTLQKV